MLKPARHLGAMTFKAQGQSAFVTSSAKFDIFLPQYVSGLAQQTQEGQTLVLIQDKGTSLPAPTWFADDHITPRV